MEINIERHQHNRCSRYAKPFLKWAGGKTQVLDNIRAKYPSALGKSVTKYAEPFVGGGAVLFDVLNNYNLSEIYISDTNRELIHTYIIVRDNCDRLILLLKDLEYMYLPADEEKRKEIYYFNRNRFNALKISGEYSQELAALFIFLNRTCFNGLYRVNSVGDFNVPIGKYKNPRICDADNIKAASEKLQNASIICKGYQESDSFIDERTLAYFDPPYRPLAGSPNFTAYTRDGFEDNEQIELARFIGMVSARGAYVIASNSDPKNANEADSFFDSIYSGYNISRIGASRRINSAVGGRGKLNELLITNF